MNNKVVVSCAVTGSGDTAKKHPNLPITPKQIAEAAIEAAKAGAAVAHIHVREPNGKPSRKIEYYKEHQVDYISDIKKNKKTKIYDFEEKNVNSVINGFAFRETDEDN